MIHLADRHALITGGAGTLGRALASVLLDRGMRVTLADLDDNRLAAAVARLPKRSTVSTIVLDVANPANWRRAVETAELRYGPVGLLCNNAGIAPRRKPLMALDIDEWEAMIAINLTSVFLGTREVVPRMAKAGFGHILNVSSMGGWIAQPERGEYCAAKAGVINLSETLRTELGEMGIGVSVLCPGAIGHEVGHIPISDEARAAEGRMDPVAGMKRAIEALIAGEFYLVTHPQAKPLVADRCNHILDAFDRAAKSR
jgi:NAD(P)-dependent dehydrogenase (short-subunit alcohol dehydrogenase family)